MFAIVLAIVARVPIRGIPFVPACLHHKVILVLYKYQFSAYLGALVTVELDCDYSYGYICMRRFNNILLKGAADRNQVVGTMRDGIRVKFSMVVNQHRWAIGKSFDNSVNQLLSVVKMQNLGFFLFYKLD